MTFWRRSTPRKLIDACSGQGPTPGRPVSTQTSGGDLSTLPTSFDEKVLDAQTRDTAADTYRAELQIPNESGELLPGAYAEVTLKFTDDSRFVTVPENALLFRREGPAVGIAGLGSYTRNQWTTAVQQRTNEQARMLVEVVHPEKSTGIIGVPLSLEPKRTLSPNRPKEFFRCVRNAKRAELPPQDRIGHRKMIASDHIEMLIC
jgi:hypothetical protein